MTTAAASPSSARLMPTTMMLLLLVTAFIASRLWVLEAAPIRLTTTGLFMEAGFEYRAARASGASVYAIHARHADEIARARREAGGPAADPARGELEYPPLCVAWLALPTLLAPAGPLDQPTAAQIDAANSAFRWMLAIADAITFALLWLLLRRIYPEDRKAWWWRLAVYVAAGLILFNVLYDRFDLVMTMLVMLALALLIGRWHWSIAMAALAVGVNFKVVPIVLVLVFAIGATRIEAARAWRRFVPAVIVRCVVAVAMCGVIFLPFFLRDGTASLGFLRYHAERGLQIESVPATLALLFSSGISLNYTHGATEVTGGPTRALAHLSTALTLVAVTAISLVMLIRARRLAMRSIDIDASSTLAQAYPRFIAVFSLLMLWAVMSAGKVFSPQYLLWLTALVALAPRPGGRGVAFAAAFLVLCGLTTAIFPYHYFSDIVRPLIAPPHYALLPPTLLGLWLLAIRNGLFVAMLVWLIWITAGPRHASR